MADVPQRSRRSTTSQAGGRTIGRLIEYEIDGLFGIFSYKFDLDDEGLTLLTGVNGTGKSTILRTIDSVSTGNWMTLLEIPFRSFTLIFDSGRKLSVVKSKAQMEISLSGEDPWIIKQGSHVSADYEVFLQRYQSLLASELAFTNSPGYRDEIRYLRERLRQMVPLPGWAERLPGMFPVLFITDQRLTVDKPGRRIERENVERVSTRVAADEVARQIAQEISAAKSAYANRSQVLDRDLPQRVVKALSGRTSRASEQALRQRLDDLARQSKDLEAVGLSPTESVGEFEDLDLATPNVRAFLKVYVEDAQKKLAVLEPLRVKLQLFTDFLRQHYGRKYVQIDPDRGFVIRVGTDEFVELPPARLSSGEQQILVLAHEILFKARPGTLVLIDEPELSLHVIWQASFVDDLILMGQVNNLSFLLATHSPTLIGGREELKRSLDVLGRE